MIQYLTAKLRRFPKGWCALLVLIPCMRYRPKWNVSCSQVRLQLVHATEDFQYKGALEKVIEPLEAGSDFSSSVFNFFVWAHRGQRKAMLDVTSKTIVRIRSTFRVVLQ